MSTNTSAILYPHRPRLALRLGFPPIVGVLIYTVIRIIADSNNNGFIDLDAPCVAFCLRMRLDSDSHFCRA